MRITIANILGIECKTTSREGFQYRHGRWRLCNIESIDVRRWKRRTNGRSWGQNNIDLKALDDKKIVEHKL